ncbi:hypothetical protein D9M71_748120 [compost metagenome]
MPEHLAGVGLHDAVDDLHQGAFACTVFAEQGVDFTRGDGQVDGIVGQAAGVAFTDSAQLQAGRRIGNGHDRLGSIECMPVDKAIFWPSGQEICLAPMRQAAVRAARLKALVNRAPHKCRAVEPAPILRAGS